MTSPARRSATRREIDRVRAELRSMSDPAAARRVKAALGSPLAFYGVPPPQVRLVARRVARRHRRDRSLGAVLSAARALWKSPRHEERSVAIQLVAEFVRRLGPQHWVEFKEWLRTVSSADHCDGIAVHLLGSLVKRDRSWCRVLKHWTRSTRVWERRAAVMAVRLRARQMGDVEAAFTICEPLMNDPATQVREAVATVLTEAGASDPSLTREFRDRWRGKGAPDVLRALRRL